MRNTATASLPTKSDQSCNRDPAKKPDQLRMNEAINGFVACDQGADQNDEHNHDASEVLGPAIAIGERRRRLAASEDERHPKRNGGGCVADVVDRIGKQSDAPGYEDDGQLQRCRDRKDHERPFDRKYPTIRRGDRCVDHAMCVAVVMTVMMVIMIVMMPVIRKTEPIAHRFEHASLTDTLSAPLIP